MTASELESLITLFRERGQLENPTVAEMRERFGTLADLLPTPTDAIISTLSVGAVPAEFVQTDDWDQATTVLYLHGGGYVIGSPATHRTLAYNLAAASAARILLIDYRLAPEHPFPAPVDDAVSAYTWLLEQGNRAEQIAIAGDSAGGGLTIAALVEIRDRGLPLPAAAVSISPWVDLECAGESMISKADVDPMVQRDGILWFAAHYLNSAAPKSPLASPLYAELGGLPPTLVQVGTAETLLDDAVRLTAALEKAGVAVTYREWPDMIHVWHLFAPMLSEGREAIVEAGAFIRQLTGS